MDGDWRSGRVGRLLGGQYAGRYVRVEEDASRRGFHIWLLQTHLEVGSSEGWDIWADDHAQVDEWFSTELSSVEWVG